MQDAPNCPALPLPMELKIPLTLRWTDCRSTCTVEPCSLNRTSERSIGVDGIASAAMRIRESPVKEDVLEQLADVLRRAEGGAGQGSGRSAAEHAASSAASSGSTAIDRLLPSRGLPRGTLVEWLAPAWAGGAGTLALCAAREAASPKTGTTAGVVVVVEQSGNRAGERAPRFYPPAAAAWGVDLSRLVVVRPRSSNDEMWALDQVARCRGVATWLWWGDRIDGRHFRRLQLAAEAGGTLGQLVRPLRMQSEPSWAAIRLIVEPRGRASERSQTARQVRVRLLRARRGGNSAVVNLEIDDATHTIRETQPSDMATELAHPTAYARRTGA